MDRLIMAALSSRRRFESLRQAVPQGMVTPETLAMLQWYQLYFTSYPDRDAVIHDELETLVRLRCEGMPRESVALTLHLVETLRTPVPEDALAGVLTTLHDLDLSGKLGSLVSRYNNGEEVDLAYEAQRLSQEVVRAKGQSDPASYIEDSIESILGEISKDQGLKFRRIRILHDNILGLQGGASVAVAARPDKGKTSLVADILTDFAPQAVEWFGADRPILWLCNEGDGKRIIPRIYQAALGLDLDEVIALSNQGLLKAAYEKAIGAPSNYIRVKNAHGMSMAQVEQIIQSMKPSVVVFDMVANFRTGGKAQGGNKADEVEQLWQQVRELAVLYDFVSIGTVQVSADGDNNLYPAYSAMKDSKTAVQGATDIILMLGALNNPDAQALRGISTPKNKFAPPKGKSFVQSELYFDGARCRFKEGV